MVISYRHDPKKQPVSGAFALTHGLLREGIAYLAADHRLPRHKVAGGHLDSTLTFPAPLFRKRRHLLDLLFRTSIECLRDWFRARLDLPDGQLAAIAAVQTFPNRILVLDGDPIPPDEFLRS